MRIRSALVIAGIAGTFVLTFSAGSVLAAPTPDPMTQVNQLLASYEQTNQRLAVCMKGKGLEFNPRLAKSDIVDAFGIVPKDALTDKIRAEMGTRSQSAPDDPNGPLMARMSPASQASWASAVNECSAQLDFEMSGGAEGKAKITALKRAAAESPEVKAAAGVYVNCMRDRGFVVEGDPFVAPQAVSEAEHGNSSASADVVEKYDNAWRSCVKPYQEAYDRRLFG